MNQRISNPLLVMACLLLVLSCTKESKPSASTSADSIMKDYFATLDSFPSIDTLNEDFRLLKAYYKKDIAYLRESHDDLVSSLRLWNELNTVISCDVTQIDSLNFDEAYRFIYEASFCDTSMVMTVGKRNAEIIAEITVQKMDPATNNCLTVERIEKKLDHRVWEKLVKGIRYADFWRLKTGSGANDVDGSRLYVFGFQKPVNAFRGRYKVVERQSPETTAFGAVFKDLIDATNSNVSCFHYNFPE